MNTQSSKIGIVALTVFLFGFVISPPLSAQRADSFEEMMKEKRVGALGAAAPLSNPLPRAAVKDPQITLELKGVDILDVLKILSVRSGINVVAGANVHGPVTVYLQNVSIRKALDTIVSALGFAYEIDDDIIKVITQQEYQMRHGRMFRDARVTRAFHLRFGSLEAAQQTAEQLKGPQGKVILDAKTNTLIISDRPEIIKEIQPLIAALDQPQEMKVFKFEYASADDMEEQLTGHLTPNTGILKVDKRSNQVSVTDRKEIVKRIGEIIHALDVRPLQVLIEAQIIEVDLFDAFRFGIDWEFVRDKLTSQLSGVDFQPAFDMAAPSSQFGSGALSTFTVGNTRFAKGLKNVAASILQNVGKTNVLSAPRVTVLNNEEAKLTDATNEPFVTSTVVQGSTTENTTVADRPEFINVGVILTVVPTITNEGTVVLRIKPEVSTKSDTDFTVPTAAGSVTTAFNRTIPVVSTQSLETTVIVKSGETLIVGGLIKDKELKTLRKLPFLGDIPFLGALFKSETIDFNKTELVIFLTPYIISGDVSSRERGKFLDQEGSFIDFDKVGGFDFALGQEHSQGPFRKDNRPYWKIEGSEYPRYGAPNHLYLRSKPYAGKRNQFENFQEGRTLLPEKYLLLKEYEQYVYGRVLEVLRSVKELSVLTGTMELVLYVRRDGAIEDVSFVSTYTTLLNDEKLRRLILKKVRSAGPFRKFPAEMDSEWEIFDLRYEFEKRTHDDPPPESGTQGRDAKARK